MRSASGVGELAVTGAALRVRWACVIPCARRRGAIVCSMVLALVGGLLPATASADRVDRLPMRVLSHEAEKVVTTGGVLGTCHGCATPYMRRLSRELIERAFVGDARRWALCVVRRESGFNPGAISSTGDYGLAQFHRATWSRIVNVDLSLVDPVYAVRAFVRVSDAGWHRTPWRGGRHAC